MDYKAEYKRITGKEWDFCFDPADLTPEGEMRLLLWLFGNESITASTRENARQWVWKPPTVTDFNKKER